MLLNESKFKDMRKRKERVTEKNWKYKIDKDLAFKLRDILEDDDTDYEALRDVMKDIYDNIHRLIPDMFDEYECENAKEELDILDTEDSGYYGDEDEDEDLIDVEDSWNYELSNLYDICDTFNIWIPIRSLDEGAVKKKKVNKKAIKESVASPSIKKKVYDVVYEIFMDAGDNLAHVVHSKVPEYDLDWCKDDGYNSNAGRSFESFVKANVDDLFYYADELDEDSVYEEVLEFLEEHPYDKDSDAEEIAAEVLSNLYDLDYETCDGEISHAAYNAAEDYLDNLDESVKSKKFKESAAPQKKPLSTLVNQENPNLRADFNKGVYVEKPKDPNVLTCSVKKLKESEEDQFCIVAITKEGKKVYYKEGRFVENKAEATIFNDLDEARSEWFDIDKSKFKRVFVPKYEATKESLDKDGNHETCDNCGTLLTDAGECPKCDLGDEDVNNKKDEGLSNKLKKKGR